MMQLVQLRRGQVVQRSIPRSASGKARRTGGQSRRRAESAEVEASVTDGYEADHGFNIEPTATELNDVALACNRLWQLDRNRLDPSSPDLQVNVQAGKKVFSISDKAPDKLFTAVSDEVWQRPTFRAFIALLDNYNSGVDEAEEISSEKIYEGHCFLNAILREPVMQYVHRYLWLKGKAPMDRQLFKQELGDIWFRPYARGGAANGSSGFEHIFVGEVGRSVLGKHIITGFHNWIHFYLEEKAGNVDYQGFVLPRRRNKSKFKDPRGDESFQSVQFRWKDDLLKNVSGMFIGTSPEFEVALYTLLFYEAEAEIATVMYAGRDRVGVRIVKHKTLDVLFSAYPERPEDL